MNLRRLLQALNHCVGTLLLYGMDHRLVAEAIDTLEEATLELVEEDDEPALISIFDDRLFFRRRLRSHESLEFVHFIRSMESHGVESIGFDPPVRRADLQDLVLFLAGLGDPPVGGSVRFNESHFRPEDTAASRAESFRARYLSAMDALRSAIYAVQSGEQLDLTLATWSVQGLLETSVDDPAAAVLLATLKRHDQYTFYHSVNVAVLSIALATAAGLSRSDVEGLALGALLHDIGKAKVDDGVLNKPGRLDENEWEEIRLHPQEGALAIIGAAGPSQYLAAAVAFEHHAGFSRSGYPTYTGAPVPHPASRLVSVADAYDALTTRRSYRRAETPTRAQLALRRGAGEHFDPQMVDLLHTLLSPYPVGAVLRLSAGEVAVVTAPALEGEPVHCMILRGRRGEFLEHPQPVRVAVEHILDELPPESAEVQPSVVIDFLE